MLRPSAGLVLLAALALLSPAAVAGPPEAAPGRMAFDAVARGLDRYRVEKDLEKRAKWLVKLAPTKDPRVAIALHEALENWSGKVQRTALDLILDYYCPPPGEIELWSVGVPWMKVETWWKKNEADLRRRAAQLPR
jgi:hypothetical protein